MTKNNGFLSEKSLRLANGLLGEIGLEFRLRITMARKVDVINLEPAISQRRGDQLHRLFTHIEPVHDENSAKRGARTKVMNGRSEERRVGKEGRSWWQRRHIKREK